MSLPCSICDLIPQKAKMAFDQILIKANIDYFESTAVIKEDNIFLTDNHQLSNIVLIEYINQLTAAVWRYYGKGDNKNAEKYLFVGLQEAEFFHAVYLGDRLTLKGFVMEEIAQVFFVQGNIYRDGERVAALVSKLYKAQDSIYFDGLTNNQQVQARKDTLSLNQNQPPAYLGSSIHRELYSYLQEQIIDDNFISFKIACPDDFRPFDGHFPGTPVLPGIIFLEIANLALNLFFSKTVKIRTINKMKIGKVVLPNQIISCMVKIERLDSKLFLKTVFTDLLGTEISRFSGSLDEG